MTSIDDEPVPGLPADVMVMPYPASESPEPGVPDLIVHGYDYDLTHDGLFEYQYNFLDYFWQIDGEDFRARAYLDEADRGVAVYVGTERLKSDPKLTPLIRYLLRRHWRIEGFDKELEPPYRLAIVAGKPESSQ